MDTGLIQFCATSTGLSETAVLSLLSNVREYTAREIRSGKEVKIERLGTFSGKLVPAHLGRNPRTGGSVHVPEKYKAVFKFFKSFLEYIQPFGEEGNPEENYTDDVTVTPDITPEATPSPLALSLSLSLPVEASPNTSKESGTGLPMTNAMMLTGQRNWYAALPNQTVEIAEQSLISSGVTSETLVWTQGMPGWERAGNVVDLKYLFMMPNPLTPPPLPY
jgi:nucleoid DNA-binding protein